MFKRQYQSFNPDYEVNEGDYIVDDSNYESLEDLLLRCVRDMRPLPEHTPGLVEDLEVSKDFDYTDKVDQVLFPEDYDPIEPTVQPTAQPEHDLSSNISEREEPTSEAPVGD